MKKTSLSCAAALTAIVGAIALPSCDRPADGLNPLQKAEEKTVYPASESGTSTAASDATAPTTTTTEKPPEPVPSVVKTETPKPVEPAPVTPPPVPEKTEPTPAPTPPPVPTPAPAPAATGGKVSIKPEMPKPLFAGTPLPDSNPPPNLDKTGKPVLEVAVPEGVSLLSKGKPVTSSDTAPLGDLSLVTDGDKQGDDGYFVDILPLKQWVQIDLGESKEVHLIWVWHFHKQAVIYKDVVVQISDDPEFKTSTTVFNNDFDNSSSFGVGTDQSWVETNNGRPMPVAGVKGRYVRLYSNGRNIDDTNQLIEVEVYGK